MQLAWLYAPQSKLPGTPSRAHTLRESGKPLPLPPNPHPELLELFHEAGPWMDYGGMDRAPLSAQELRAWADGVGAGLSPWEFGTLLDMSQHYVNQSRASKDEAAPPPWSVAPADGERKAIARSLRSLLRE